VKCQGLDKGKIDDKAAKGGKKSAKRGHHPKPCIWKKLTKAGQ
jgi:hypothetical protein